MGMEVANAFTSGKSTPPKIANRLIIKCPDASLAKMLMSLTSEKINPFMQSVHPLVDFHNIAYGLGNPSDATKQAAAVFRIIAAKNDWSERTQAIRR